MHMVPAFMQTRLLTLDGGNKGGPGVPYSEGLLVLALLMRAYMH